MADADVDEPVNARATVERLWNQLDDELVEGEPAVAELPDFLSPVHNENIRYLNAHWDIDPASDALAGSEWKAKAKDRLAGSVLSVLDRYFEQERQFFAHTVRSMNDVAEWLARLAREVRTVGQSVTDESHRLRDRQDLLHQRLLARIAELEDRLAELEARR